MVVDIGAGTGHTLRHIGKRGGVQRLFLCDMAENAVARDRDPDAAAEGRTVEHVRVEPGEKDEEAELEELLQENDGADDATVQTGSTSAAVNQPPGRADSGSDLEVVRIVVDEEFLPFREHSADLVISNLALHWVNDLPGTLRQVRRMLKPDGAFIGAIFGGDNLHELRASLVAAELERRGGLSPRVSPSIQVADAARLLGDAGFRMPTVDTSYIEVEFNHAIDLLEFVQGMGESNAASQRHNDAPGDLLMGAASLYQMQHPANEDAHDLMERGVKATFQVIFLIGWAPSASQPKPLPRGSRPKGFHIRKDGTTEN